MKYLAALLRLIRWPNLVIIAVSQVLLWQCIINPLLKSSGMEVQLPLWLFIALVGATVCIAAGGYAINDYFDRKIDRVNKPSEIIVGSLINPRKAMAYHMAFTLCGLFLGTFVSLKIRELYLSLIFFMVSGLLWFYSTTYKRQFLLGNVIVALLTALVPFLVVLYELPLLADAYGSKMGPLNHVLITWALGFSLFAFLVNLIREIVKDGEDFEGDQAYGKQTVPVVWGMKAARVISAGLALITIVLLALAWLRFVRDRVTLVYFFVVLAVPLGLTVFLLMGKTSKPVWHTTSRLLKLVMLGGLGYMVAVNMIINNMH
ncbi:MAG: geranylgeranylglycerol-phosphate geranylgeranyltransferase [Bacteroidales bacterium]|nr:geranylgeranylglycerol-phosphate geranylgeranyltransferase [Bacteroidales bacterium]